MSPQRLMPAVALVCLLSPFGPPMAQQQDFSRVEIVTVPVADGLYMLVGQGGNIGVSVGEDGIVLVDDQFAPLVPRIKTALAELGDGPVRVVLNTHWHFDHTGGNELLAGHGAMIVAHENVRKRMSSEQFIATFQMTMPPSPAAALPVVTFTRDVKLHLNGVTIEVQHAPPAHTDGDSIVWFRELNAVHMGDTYFNGMYPFIDFSTGGNIRGMIQAVDATLSRMDANTRIIPGHGPLSDAEALRAYRDMLATVADRIDSLIAEGKSVDDVIAAKPASDYDASLGQGFLKSDDWIRMVYQSMTAQ